MKPLSLCGVLALSLAVLAAAQEKTKTKEPEAKKTAKPKRTDATKTEKEKETSKEKSALAGKPQLRPEVTNLYNPCGVAIQPNTGDVFIADSGNLRILRYQANLKPRPKIAEEITDFAKDVYGKGPMYDIGPLGLLFLNRNILVVGDGGHVDGQELLYFFDVSQGAPQAADNAKYKIGPIGPTPGKTDKGEGNFYALAYHAPTTIFFTTNGDDTKGWVAKVGIKDNTPDKVLELAIATKEFTGEVDAPVGITMSPDKKLVIGQMGEVSGKPKDSLLLVYDPDTGKPLMKAETGLYDIAALAYHPQSNKLYALDYAWMEPKEGGLFRLDVSGEGANAKVKAEKIMPLDKPTAMAFAADGALYITEIGTQVEKSPKKPGRLVRVTGLQ